MASLVENGKGVLKPRGEEIPFKYLFELVLGWMIQFDVEHC